MPAQRGIFVGVHLSLDAVASPREIHQKNDTAHPVRGRNRQQRNATFQEVEHTKRDNPEEREYRDLREKLVLSIPKRHERQRERQVGAEPKTGLGWHKGTQGWRYQSEPRPSGSARNSQPHSLPHGRGSEVGLLLCWRLIPQ